MCRRILNRQVTQMDGQYDQRHFLSSASQNSKQQTEFVDPRKQSHGVGIEHDNKVSRKEHTYKSYLSQKSGY